MKDDWMTETYTIDALTMMEVNSVLEGKGYKLAPNDTGSVSIRLLSDKPHFIPPQTKSSYSISILKPELLETLEGLSLSFVHKVDPPKPLSEEFKKATSSAGTVSVQLETVADKLRRVKTTKSIEAPPMYALDTEGTSHESVSDFVWSWYYSKPLPTPMLCEPAVSAKWVLDSRLWSNATIAAKFGMTEEEYQAEYKKMRAETRAQKATDIDVSPADSDVRVNDNGDSYVFSKPTYIGKFKALTHDALVTTIKSRAQVEEDIAALPTVAKFDDITPVAPSHTKAVCRWADLDDD